MPLRLGINYEAEYLLGHFVRMKSIRYILGVVGFVVVWFAVAAVVGLCLSFLFPPAVGHDGVINWRSLPGSILGIWFGYHSFRVIVRASEKTVAK